MDEAINMQLDKWVQYLFIYFGTYTLMNQWSTKIPIEKWNMDARVKMGHVILRVLKCYNITTIYKHYEAFYQCAWTKNHGGGMEKMSSLTNSMHDFRGLHVFYPDKGSVCLPGIYLPALVKGWIGLTVVAFSIACVTCARCVNCYVEHLLMRACKAL